MAVKADAVSSSSRGGSSDLLQVPLLAETLTCLDSGERMTLLDLGPPRSATVEYLSGYRCRLGIADALLELADADAGGVLAGPGAGAHLHRALPGRSFADSELILCWGLPDYLSHGGIRALGQHLASLAVPGTALHMLIAYGAAAIPSRPRAYSLAAGGVRSDRPPADDPGVRPPRHSSGELQRLLPDWHLDRSVLLSNGMQEYRFRC